MIAVIAASSAKRRSVQILTYCRGRCIYTASRARHICMLRDNWPVIDWREPIGLQERLEGRSSHNGVISVMSRSRFQGTEVTIVTGAFSVCSIVLSQYAFWAGIFLNGRVLSCSWAGNLQSNLATLSQTLCLKVCVCRLRGF